MSDHLLIIGAGYTGERLARLMLTGDWSITMLNREPPEVPGSTALAIDLDNPGGLESALQPIVDAQRRFSIAYLVPPANPDPNDTVDDPRLLALLDALPASPTRVVLASTSGVYGDHQGRDVDEATPPNPATRRASNRVRLERTLLKRAAQTAMSTVILRIAGIYGPGRLPLDAIRALQPVIDPTESGPGNRIHVDDLAATFARALTHANPPAIVNVADGDHCSSSAFTLEVARQAGLEAPPTISRAVAQETFSAMRLSFLNESRRLDTTCLREQLGVELRYADHRQGIAAILGDDAR